MIAIEKFYRVNKVVKPKKETLGIADAEFNAAMADLNVKKAELKVRHPHAPTTAATDPFGAGQPPHHRHAT